MKPQDILRAARDYIGTGGKWCQGALCTADQRVCGIGSINYVTGQVQNYPGQLGEQWNWSKDSLMALKALACAIAIKWPVMAAYYLTMGPETAAGSIVPEYNDGVARSAADMVDRMNEAIELLDKWEAEEERKRASSTPGIPLEIWEEKVEILKEWG